MDVEQVAENEAMELEQSEGEEEEEAEGEKSKNLPEDSEKPRDPALIQCEQAGTGESEETQKATKSISSLPRNKEELECLIEHIQETVTGSILPKLHRCLTAKVCG